MRLIPAIDLKSGRCVRLYQGDFDAETRYPVEPLALAQRYHGLPPIIFTTAFDQHAVAAFAVHAVDYLLKPVSVERLGQAVVRAAQRVRTSADAAIPDGRARHAATSVLGDLMPLGLAGASPRVVVHDRGDLRLFDASAIARFWATDKYTAFLADGREQLTAESLPIAT